MKNIIDMYLKDFKSIPEIAKELKIGYSKVRNYLIANNVKRRTRKEGIVLYYKSHSNPIKGKRRKPFSKEWKQNISKSRLKWAEKNAKGISLKPNGYYEVTRGENKGRSLHVVIMENKIGRKLTKEECVHHIDGNRSNNDINNLQIMTRSEHTRLHAINNNKRKRNNYGSFN
jgi:hypothetical protein